MGHYRLRLLSDVFRGLASEWCCFRRCLRFDLEVVADSGATAVWKRDEDAPDTVPSSGSTLARGATHDGVTMGGVQRASESIASPTGKGAGAATSAAPDASAALAVIIADGAVWVSLSAR